MVAEPLTYPHLILAGKAVITTNYNRGGEGGFQSLSALLEGVSTPGRMIRYMGICPRIWEIGFCVPASLNLSWAPLAHPGTDGQWC